FHFTAPSPPSTSTLSLHDALPILHFQRLRGVRLDDITFNFTHENVTPTDTMGSPGYENDVVQVRVAMNINVIVSSLVMSYGVVEDRKSTRLNSSHVSISYAVFCLK